MSADCDGASFHFSLVRDGSSEDVSVLPLEKFLESGCREFVTVDGFVWNRTMSPTCVTILYF